MKRKAMMGNKVRSLRKRSGLTQAQLAEQLGISPSYMNLIEHNRRAVTVPVLLRLADVLGADLGQFAADDEARMVGELAEVFGDRALSGHELGPSDLAELTQASPTACRAILDLYRAYRSARDDARAMVERYAGGAAAGADDPLPPEDQVTDLIQQYNNHFPELEAAAEAIRVSLPPGAGEIDRHLVRHLQEAHDVTVEVVPGDPSGSIVRRFDPKARRLALSEVLPPRSRSFQLAHQLALLGCRTEIDAVLARARPTTPDARALTRVALANYFAGAVLMPYDAFLEAAREVRYDVEMLGHRFRTSFEQVCHRLTTLQRPGATGVPFHFVRVDIAGNVSKRFSASGIRFSRYGGSCPRWNVHAAFLSPGFIRTQLSAMPDGTTFFCIARTVRKEGGGFLVPQTRLAIGLGCEISHARELVYADGVDLDNLDAAVPIGVTCRLCERTDCRQRAFPPLLHTQDVDENVRGASIYVWPVRPGA
ncbi:MAG: helix-turn-helix domain-containing protein [Planctomycetota bacterium]|jgi:predicted transcriptional regulator/transcriptional regulator with XRE-family HTH domain